MSSNETTNQAMGGITRTRRIAITVTVMMASSMYALDWTIAAVALPHMQGTFSATQDQISWVLTSYIVISAIALPTTAWLSERIGRRYRLSIEDAAQSHAPQLRLAGIYRLGRRRRRAANHAG